MTPPEKIAVVGGGPAGAMAALHLAKAGANVDLYEPKGAWEKPCAGAVTPKVRDRVPEINRLDRPFTKVAVGRFVSPGGVMVELTSRRPLWVLARKELNGFFLDTALSQPGVSFIRERVRHIETLGVSFSVIGDSERLYGGVIGCDGITSIVRRRLAGPFPNRHAAVCKGYYLESEGENTAVTQFAPFHGYFWSFPRPDSVCVGAGSRDKKAPVDRWMDSLAREYYPGRKKLGRYGALMPAVCDPSFYDEPVCGDNWALCGDAAGYVDAMSGEGILYALESGREAAKAMIEGRAASYRERVMDTFGRHLRACAMASRFFYNAPVLDRLYKTASKSETLRGFLIDFMSDQPEASEARTMLFKSAPKILREILWP